MPLAKLLKIKLLAKLFITTLGADIPKEILLIDPPGTVKTLLARDTAHRIRTKEDK